MSQWLNSVITGSTSAAEPTFREGDTVDVLNPIRLPKVEDVRHTGVIQRVDERGEGKETLYWVSGRAVACTARVLRLVKCG